MRRFIAVLAAGLLAAGAALGDNESLLWLDAPVSDEDFHRVVACGVPPGQRCAEPMVFWPPAVRGNLTVAFRSMKGASSAPRRALLQQALDRAIRQVNGVGADLALVRDDDDPEPQITVWDSRFTDGEQYDIPREEIWDDMMEGARVHIWWDGDRHIYRGTIVIAADLAHEDFNSVMLEELVQSLGLLTDVEGSAYADISIFSETSNAVTRLRGQDAAAIRLHYPRE